jgi:hypothetical protein
MMTTKERELQALYGLTVDVTLKVLPTAGPEEQQKRFGRLLWTGNYQFDVPQNGDTGLESDGKSKYQLPTSSTETDTEEAGWQKILEDAPLQVPDENLEGLVACLASARGF